MKTNGKDSKKKPYGKRDPKRQPYDKGGSKGDYTPSETKAHNDPAWYNHSPELVQSAGNIPFVNFTGIPLNIGGDIPYTVKKGYTLPGICTLRFSPSCGIANSKEDAVNVMSNKVYAEMRRWNSGSRNYESPDYMMHLLAIDSAFMLWADAVRAYGLVNKYILENRYTPNHLFTALGLDYDNIARNMAQFRTYINTFAAKLNTCPLPKIFDMTKRHIFMCSNIYTDHSNSKSQFYAFKPNYVYKLDTTTLETGTSLVPVEFQSTMTYMDYKFMFDEVIDSLLTDEDASIMAGDTVKAFGECWTVGAIPEDYAVEFTYDEQMLSQIHNASILAPENTSYPMTGYTGPADTRVVYQENGVLKHTPHVIISNGNVRDESKPVDGGHILDFSGNEQPTALEVMYISRLQAVLSDTKEVTITSTPSYGVAAIESCGSEYITDVKIYTLNADTDRLVSTNVYKFLDGTVNYAVKAMAETSQFKWHPRVLIINTAGTGGSFTVTDQLWESKNIGVLSKDNIKNLNEVAIMSLLDLPIRS